MNLFSSFYRLRTAPFIYQYEIPNLISYPNIFKDASSLAASFPFDPSFEVILTITPPFECASFL